MKLDTSKKNKLNINIGNIELDQNIKGIKPKDKTTLSELTYSAAKAITNRCGMKKKYRNRKSHKKPTWKLKIQKEIEVLRRKLSILEDLSKWINVREEGRKGVPGREKMLQNTK